MSDDYYSILGVTKTAGPAEIKKAYVKLARDHHPDRFKDPAEREAADQKFSKITEAYNQLRDERTRKEYDKSLARQSRSPEEEAKLYHKNGLMREETKDYDSAIKLFYEAMRIQPDNLEYVLSTARVLALVKSKQRQAADLLNQAMEKHPMASEPHLELGALYQRSGMLHRAKRVYENAIGKFGDDPEIKRRLSDVNAAMEKARK